MPEALPYIGAAILAMAVWWIALDRLGVFVAEDVRAWRRLALLRGHTLPQTPLEKALHRSRSIRRMQAELDLDRLLAYANRDDSPLGFLGRTLALALIVFAATLLLDAVARALLGEWPAPPWVALGLGVAIIPLSLVELRTAARRARESAEATLGDMLMQVAVITDTRGLQPHDAVRVLSRCTRERSLSRLIDEEGFRRLAAGRYTNTVATYRAIAASYELPLFAQVAETLATTHVGVPERQAFSRLALAVCEQRLTDARVRAARAKTLVTLPVAAMLIPLLLLIAAPTFQAISSGLGGG